MAFRPILRLLHELRGVPLEIYAALGHGRSYGSSEQRERPRAAGDHDVWTLGKVGKLSAAAPARALLTDIGNDLFYNTSVDEILEWIRLALRRLRPRCEQIALTLVPIENARAINSSFYDGFRRVCFANCRVTHDEMLERAAALNDGLVELAAEYQVTLIEQPRAWYGWDPIHHRRGSAAGGVGNNFGFVAEDAALSRKKIQHFEKIFLLPETSCIGGPGGGMAGPRGWNGAGV